MSQRVTWFVFIWTTEIFSVRQGCLSRPKGGTLGLRGLFALAPSRWWKRLFPLLTHISAKHICSNYPGVTLSLSTDCAAKENCSDPASFQCTKFHRDQQIRSLRDITRTNHAAKITRCTCCFHRAIHPAHKPVLVAGPKVGTDNFVSNDEVALMAAKIFFQTWWKFLADLAVLANLSGEEQKAVVTQGSDRVAVSLSGALVRKSHSPTAPRSLQNNNFWLTGFQFATQLKKKMHYLLPFFSSLLLHFSL